MIELIIWSIFALAIIFLAVIIFRKMPVISAIDVQAQPGNRNKRIKAELLEQRLERKVSLVGRWFTKYIKPFWQGVRDGFRRLTQTVNELNRSYARRIKVDQAADAGSSEKAQKIQQLLAEADDHMKKEEWREAEERLIEVVTFDQKNIEAYHRLGDLYLEMKNYEDASETFEYLIKLNKADDVAYSGLAQISQTQGRLSDAKDDYEHSIKLNTKVAQHHHDLCRVFMEMEQYDDAVKECTSAVRLEPKNPKMIALLLETYIIKKDSANAKATLERLKEVNPENQRLAELKTQIDNLN